MKLYIVHLGAHVVIRNNNSWSTTTVNEELRFEEKDIRLQTSREQMVFFFNNSYYYVGIEDVSVI